MEAPNLAGVRATTAEASSARGAADKTSTHATKSVSLGTQPSPTTDAFASLPALHTKCSAAKLSGPELRQGQEPKVVQPGFLHLRGLPHSCTAQDLCHFFRGYGTLQEDVTFSYGVDGNFWGFAWVWFPDSQVASQAKAALHCSRLGQRYVEIAFDGDAFAASARW